MCIVSYVGDHYNDEWKRRFPQIDEPWICPPNEPRKNPDKVQPIPNVDELMKKLFPKKNGPTQEEFDALKREVEQMKELLKKAKEMDQALGTPDCELEQKVALLKLMAAAVGVDLEEVFGKKNGN